MYDGHVHDLLAEGQVFLVSGKFGFRLPLLNVRSIYWNSLKSAVKSLEK